MNTVQLSQRFSAIEKQIAEIKDALITGGLLELPPAQPRPAELPTVDAKVTHRFRASASHPFTVVAEVGPCPSCGKAQEEPVQFTIGENGGTTVTSCQCGQNLRVKFAWDASMK
jgi:hypothetical protein